MTTTNEPSEQDFQEANEALQRLTAGLESAIAGQNRLITHVLTAFFAGGHILMEGLPGLGKTHLAKALAATTDFAFSRIQCTPDLMPADITGSDILYNAQQGEHRFVFQPGPIFSPIVLVDEINRATPRTQAALLEAMQEHQVTYTGTTHSLPRPFWVLATQNPIEIEGTYPLPEAQLDRFLVKLKVDFPDQEALLSILEISLDSEPSERLEHILSRERVIELMKLCQQIVISDHIKRAAVQLLLTTHPEKGSDSHHFRYGASPRGLQALLRTARVHALMNDRLQVDLDDLAAVAMPAMRHRVLLTIESELEGIDSDELLESLIQSWRAQI